MKLVDYLESYGEQFVTFEFQGLLCWVGDGEGGFYAWGGGGGDGAAVGFYGVFYDGEA